MNARLLKMLQDERARFQQEEEDWREDDELDYYLHSCIVKKRWTENSAHGDEVESLDVDTPYENTVLGRNFMHLTGFSFDSPGRAAGIQCHGCKCDEGIRVRRAFRALLGRDGNLCMQTIIHISSTRRQADDNYGWTSLHEQLAAHPVFIPCAFVDQHYGLHELEDKDAKAGQLRLLHCKFCSTRVRHFVSRPPWLLMSPRHIFVRTTRNLGRATETADENWHAQTAFSSEALERDEDKERQSPWRSWWKRAASEQSDEPESEQLEG
jgi:hypothetical protein